MCHGLIIEQLDASGQIQVSNGGSCGGSGSLVDLATQLFTQNNQLSVIDLSGIGILVENSTLQLSTIQGATQLVNAHNSMLIISHNYVPPNFW